ncbi:LLM class flavin-dependent oxidoreductase [Kribbella qitaiheensis]|uniref:LLM class flavin-dependent oxidoreductase n=1 Tax=Kribbella qitaiheensis TaxID=1544730 RepID=A0A7G6WZW0_9ACTN|nr:LLM class flavin-dependent oxidoreductase [Kribbella qitaiheensis]QNE19525.1 LLM class flavin-dependent oxidoreductase [Kribbella qitaiheensis]
MKPLKSAVWVPLFDELADARVIARLAASAEEAGWDGLFVWDHVRWRHPVRAVADPWVALTAAAMASETLRIGPMVTPLARRRPAVVARQTATLDVLSGGRLTLGVGLGSDRFGEEFTRFGDEADERKRAELTDEALTILQAAWSGEPVRHHGANYTVDDVEFLPRPAQDNGVPIWIAGFPGKVRPRRRAARYDGFFPVNLTHPDELAEAVEGVQELRTDPTAPYDVVVALPPGTDPAPYAAAGATWTLTEFDPHAIRRAEVEAIVAGGPFS